MKSSLSRQFSYNILNVNMFLMRHGHIPHPAHSTDFVKPLMHLRRPLLMPALHPIIDLSPVPTCMYSTNAVSDYIPIGQSHAHPARLEGCVGGAEDTLPQVMKAVRRMVRAVVSVDEGRAYVVQAVHLVPHGNSKCKVLLP